MSQLRDTEPGEPEDRPEMEPSEIGEEDTGGDSSMPVSRAGLLLPSL